MKVQILLQLYWNFQDAVTKLDTNYILMIDYSKLNQLQTNSYQSV